MASVRWRLGPFSLGFSAQRQGAEFGIRWDGPAWDALASRLRPRRMAVEDESAADALLPTPMPHLDLPDRAPTEIAERRRLVDAVHWYHSFDFGDGVEALGQFDQRPYLDSYRLPERLDGKRVLDVATFDGFWAFEFERRGAAEVVAMDVDSVYDLDWRPARRASVGDSPPTVAMGRGFNVARLLKGSRVRREICNVYDLDPQRFGLFDVVHVGDLLLHLNSPVRALQRIASVCRGEAWISEVASPEVALGNEPRVMYRGGRTDVTWWNYSPAALRQMVHDAGFSRVEVVSQFKYGQRLGPSNMHHMVLRATR